VQIDDEVRWTKIMPFAQGAYPLTIVVKGVTL